MIIKIFSLTFLSSFLFFGYLINDIYSLPKQNKKIGFNNCINRLNKERKVNCNDSLCTISYSPSYESIRNKCRELE